MKKNINNKVYNTDTANLIGRIESETSDSDYYFLEELYQKKTGEFFIHGFGNKLSKYGKFEIGDEKIIPISYETAESWAKENLDKEEYSKLFQGKSLEKNIKTISIRDDIYQKGKMIAVKRRISFSELIENLIEKEEI